LTRKERKREKKRKPFIQKFTLENVAFLKEIAREMSLTPNTLIGIKFHCQTCHLSWEYGFDNKLVYCRECIYSQCCLKDISEFYECPICGREYENIP
jgi:hypothetical protein